jgi:hypothetical protein
MTRQLHFGFQQEDATVPFGKQQEGCRGGRTTAVSEGGDKPKDAEVATNRGKWC